MLSKFDNQLKFFIFFEISIFVIISLCNFYYKSKILFIFCIFIFLLLILNIYLVKIIENSNNYSNLDNLRNMKILRIISFIFVYALFNYYYIL